MESVKLKSNPTILYIEDNELNQLVIRKMLNALGYEQVLIAANADAATTLLENPDTQVDLILMDLGLPGTDGIALTQKIRQSQWNAKNVPIIAVTGNEEVEAKAKSFAAGMNDFLVKPVEKAQLGLKLERFFSGKK